MWFDMSFVINTHLCFKQSAKSYANFIQMIHGVTKICDTYLLQAVKVCLDNQHTGTALQSTQWMTLWCCISQHTCTCGSPTMFLTCWKEKIKYDIFSRLLGIDTYSFEINTCVQLPHHLHYVLKNRPALCQQIFDTKQGEWYPHLCLYLIWTTTLRMSEFLKISQNRVLFQNNAVNSGILYMFKNTLRGNILEHMTLIILNREINSFDMATSGKTTPTDPYSNVIWQNAM